MSGKTIALKLLVIDDTPQNIELVVEALSGTALEIFTATDPEIGWDLFLRTRPQVVLLDIVMPKLGGMELMERMLTADPGTDVILMTGHYSTESAVEAIQKGACDYLTKPVEVEKLRHRIGALLEEAEKRQKAFQLDHALVDAFKFEGMIGRSPLMLEVFARIRRVARHYQTLLVSGATGTGKELVAQALHRLSPRASAPFVVCNCSALVETLLESELFGYVRGAFTGATQDKTGIFEQATVVRFFWTRLESYLVPRKQSCFVFCSKERCNVSAHLRLALWTFE